VGRLDLILSGHIHIFDALTFQNGAPSQLILGNGGTKLSDSLPDLTGVKIGNRVVQTDFHDLAFGFMYLTRKSARSSSWNGTAYDPDGNVIAECEIAPGHLSCKPPTSLDKPLQ
jgi:hypothetical protein